MACSEGKCNPNPDLCTAGTKRCHETNHNVEECKDDGTWIVWTECPNGCDEATKTCLPECETGQKKCDESAQNALVCEESKWKEVQCGSGCPEGECNPECPEDGAKACQDNVLVVCHDKWETEETCELGCDDKLLRCKPDCETAGSTICNPDGTLVTCKDDFTLEESPCAFGCYTNSDNVSLCKPECSTVGEVRCKGDGIETCNADYNWEVTTEKCELGCSNGSCMGCSTPNETSCTSEGNIQTCQSDYTWKETSTCDLGCYDGRCKECDDTNAASCNRDGTFKQCIDYKLQTVMTCPIGCDGNECIECKKDNDCAKWGGAINSTCHEGKCITETCDPGFVLIGHATESCCVRSIPFAGNVYVTEAEGTYPNNANSIIKWDTAEISKWDKTTSTLSFYIAPKSAGSLKLYVGAKLPQNTEMSTISFTLNGVTKELTITSKEGALYRVGEWNVQEAGYIKMDIKGVSSTPENSGFALIDQFLVGGESMKEMPTCLPKALESSPMHWFRRGHHDTIWYSIPSSDNIEWFYTEITPGEGTDVPGIYLSSNSATNFYMGLQKTSSSMKKVWFNVWSSYTIKDSSELPTGVQIELLKLGKLAVPDPNDADCGDKGNNCGGEGCGYTVPICNFDWVPGKTYKTLVHVKPGGSGSSVYTDITPYISDADGNWHLIASLRKPGVSHWYTGASSFIENFEPASGYAKRTVSYGNIWYRTDKGEWKPVTQTTDYYSWLFKDMGFIAYRNDLENSVSGNAFKLSINGFFNGVTGETLPALTIKESDMKAPEIDLDAMEQVE